MSKKKIKRPQSYKKPKDRTLTEWWRDQSERVQKSILYTCVALCAVIVLLFIWYYGFYNDGSLKVKDNAIVGAQENWLIGRRDKGKNSIYYHYATVNHVEGYELGEALITSTLLTQNLTYRPVTESDIAYIYISAVDDNATSMCESAYEQIGKMVGDTGVMSEISDVVNTFGVCKAFNYTQTQTDDAGAESYAQSLVFYVPCSYRNSCLVINVTVTPETPDNYWEVSALMAEVQKVLDSLVIEKP